MRQRPQNELLWFQLRSPGNLRPPRQPGQFLLSAAMSANAAGQPQSKTLAWRPRVAHFDSTGESDDGHPAAIDQVAMYKLWAGQDEDFGFEQITSCPHVDAA